MKIVSIVTPLLTFALGCVSSVAAGGKDIVDVAIGVHNQFDTLVAAVAQADLVDDLKATGPFSTCVELQ